MSFYRIFEVILPIILIALVGYIFGKFKKIDVKTIADYIIYIGAPAMILTLLSKQQISFKEISTIVFCATTVILVTGLIAYYLFKALKIDLPKGVYLPTMFMNSGFIGYPLALFLFGELGFARAIIFDVTNAVLIFTLGIFIVSQGKNRWQLFKLPFIYAVLIGIILSVTGTRIPLPLYGPLYLLGGTSIPVSLFLLGCALSYVKITSLKIPLIAAVLRIGLGIGLGLLLVTILRLEGVIAKVIILSSSLPSAITSIAISEEYDANPSLVASTIALSTIIAVFTIPFVLNMFILN
jgi:malate permease and related proteins